MALSTTSEPARPIVLDYASAASPGASPGYKWLVVAMLWLVCLFNYADRQAIFSVFPLLRSELHLSPLQLGLLGGAFMWIYAAALPLAGLVADKLPRKTLILGGLVFWSAITLATALSHQYWQLILFRALEGLGEAFYFPASMSLISDYHGPLTRSRAMGLHQSSVYAGTVAGGTVAGLLAERYGWRSGFYLFGWLGIALAIVLLLALREPDRGQSDAVPPPPPDGATAFGAIAAVLRIPMVRLLIAVFVGANFVAAVFLTWLPTFLHDTFGMTLGMAGFNATAWLQAASVAGVIAGGVLADRLVRRWPTGRFITQTIGLLGGSVFLLFTGWTLSVKLLVLSLIGFGWCKGLYDANLWASLYDVVPLRRRATALGLMNCIGWIGGAAAPELVALTAPHFGTRACLSATSVIYLSCGILLAGAVLNSRRLLRSTAH